MHSHGRSAKITPPVVMGRINNSNALTQSATFPSSVSGYMAPSKLQHIPHGTSHMSHSSRSRSNGISQVVHRLQKYTSTAGASKAGLSSPNGAFVSTSNQSHFSTSPRKAAQPHQQEASFVSQRSPGISSFQPHATRIQSPNVPSKVSSLGASFSQYNFTRTQALLDTTQSSARHMSNLHTKKVPKARMGTPRRLEPVKHHNSQQPSSSQHPAAASSEGRSQPVNVVITSDNKTLIIDNDKVKQLRANRRKKRRRGILKAIGYSLAILTFISASAFAYIYYSVMNDPSTIAGEEVLYETEFISYDGKGNEIKLDHETGAKLYRTQQQLDQLIHTHGSLAAATSAVTDSTSANANGPSKQ